MRPRSIGLSLLGALAISSLVASSAAAGETTTVLDNGAPLTAAITTPTTGDTFLTTTGSVDVPVEGSASIGVGEPNVHWTYVIDVSGSTNGPCGATNILGCEKQAALNLNTEVIDSGSAVDVGVAVYGEGGASADMKADTGDQPLSAPDSGDVETVVNSVIIGGVTQYTAKSVGPNWTNFTAGLTAALNSVGASAAGTKNVVFMSDGLSNTGGGGFNAAVSALVNGQGANIYAFAVGPNASCTGGTNGTLQAMADAANAVNDGSCTNVPDPTNLPPLVADLVATQMTDVSLTVDGVGVTFDSNSNPPPFDGSASTDLTATAANQAPGAHEACLTAEGKGPKSDASSLDTATQCETYYVYDFDLTLAEATNELSEDQEHSVTASLGGEPGFLAGFTVDFAIIAGPNAGLTASGSTDADGDVVFTYTNPNVNPSGLGTDTIRATVDVNGQTASLDATKEWVDTIPPVASCDPSVNPNGRTQPQAPGRGGQGQNQDGFYAIGGTDNIWSDLQVFVTDTGSGTVFGPYSVDTNIKYTEDSLATPEAKSIGGGQASAVDVHIIGNGDAAVTAVDGSGNTSSSVSCLVPPPPK